MAITDDRNVRNAIWYVTDAIGNRLQNTSLLIDKLKKSTENLKDCCHNLDCDRVCGLEEQKRYIWEDWNLKELILPELKVQGIKPSTKIPTREEIEEKFTLYNDFNMNTHMYSYIYEYACEDGYKLRSECHVNAEDAINDVKRDRLLYEVREALTNKVLDHYRKKNEEEYGMTGSEFKKFENDIRMIYGNIVVEGLASNDCTAHIEVPFEYLKYIKVAMPTTDFCVSKGKDTGNWIEGIPAIKKVETYNDRVTKVTFIDDTFTKSVCSENDHFDEDVGITICCMKRLFGKDGNRMYNDMIRKAHKVIDENNKKKEAEAKEKAERKLKAKKVAGKKAAKKLFKKQEQIDIQTQAIIQAHRILEDEQREEGLI